MNFRTRQTFEHAHHRDEEQGINGSSKALIEKELDGCIFDWKLLSVLRIMLFILTTRRSREFVLDKRLPGEVWGSGEQWKECKME